jgi:hypothetical protein
MFIYENWSNNINVFFDTFTVGETPTVSIFFIYKNQNREFTALQRGEIKKRKKEKRKRKKERSILHQGEKKVKRKAKDYKFCSQSISG